MEITDGEQLKDTLRRLRIEEENRKHWTLKRYLGRNLITWTILYFGLILIILVLSRKDWIWIGEDLLFMFYAGVCISWFFFDSLFYKLQEFITDLLNLHKIMTQEIE